MKSHSIFVLGILCIMCSIADPVVAMLVASNFTIQDGDDYSSEVIQIYNTEPLITTVTMTGGDVYALVPYESSVVNIIDGYVDYTVPYDSATINMSGGGTYNIRSYDSSTVNFSGGTVAYLGAFDSSTVNIAGGVVTNVSGYGSSTINLYGKDFFVSDTGGNRGDGYITGNWADDTLFYISIFNNPDYGFETIDHINLNIVPAPPAFLLGSLGLTFAGWCLRKRKEL